MKKRKGRKKNALFIQIQWLWCHDVVDYKIGQIMQEAKNTLLPYNIQPMFAERNYK